MSENNDKTSLGVIIGILAFFLLVFIFSVGAVYSLLADETMPQNAIGVIEIKGPIESAAQTIHDIQAFTDNDEIQAMLIRIDSPGGSVSASQELVEAIQTIHKPVVISMGNMAASGGYYVACAGPKIYANPGTLTGSIGVISQILEFKDLMEFLMIRVHTVKTGTLKDAGSPFREFSETDKAYFTAMGIEILDQFVEHVAKARNLPKEKIQQLADGRVWTGREAKNLGLIDEIGGMNTAIAALKKEANLKGKYTLVYPTKDTNALLNSLLTEGASEIFDGFRASAQKASQQQESFQYLYQR